MTVRVLYFAGLKEALGMAQESLDLPAGIATVGDLRDHLVSIGRGKLGETRNLRCAVNQEMARPEAAIQAGDEIAFFPPVTGG